MKINNMPRAEQGLRFSELKGGECFCVVSNLDSLFMKLGYTLFSRDGVEYTAVTLNGGYPCRFYDDEKVIKMEAEVNVIR